MQGVEIIPLKLYEDQRGWLGEVFRKDETSFNLEMVYLSMTKPGIIRGPHEHKKQTDYFCLIGDFRLCLWDNRESSPTFRTHQVVEIFEKAPVMAIISPGIVHAYKNTGPSDGYVVNLPNRLYRGWGKREAADEIRYEDDPLSPFRM